MWLVLVIAVGASLLFAGFHVEQKERERAVVALAHKERVSHLTSEKQGAESVLVRIDAARTEEAFAALPSAIASFPAEVRSLLSQVVGGKELEERFYKQERLLFRARGLLEVNKNDPVARDYVEQARLLHLLNMDAIKKIEDIKDNCVWNYALHYLKGLAHYRGLAFVEKEDKANAKNLIDQALDNFAKALACAPKEPNDETAIELLYQKAKNAGLLGAGGGDLGALRLQVLPSGASGPDRPGTGGRDREQGRH